MFRYLREQQKERERKRQADIDSIANSLSNIIINNAIRQAEPRPDPTVVVVLVNNKTIHTCHCKSFRGGANRYDRYCQNVKSWLTHQSPVTDNVMDYLWYYGEATGSYWQLKDRKGQDERIDVVMFSISDSQTKRMFERHKHEAISNKMSQRHRPLVEF